MKNQRDGALIFIQLLMCVFLIASFFTVRAFKQSSAAQAGEFGIFRQTDNYTFSDLARVIEDRFGGV